MINNIRQIKECTACGSENLIYKEGLDQVICKDCGLIYEPLAPKIEKKLKKAKKK